MSGDINELAQISYEAGIDPIDYAEGQIKMLLEVRSRVFWARAENPDSFPIYSRDLSDDALARRIIGDLMDAGWKPPTIGGDSGD